MLHPSKVLKELNLSPKKSFSQNFLINIDSLQGSEGYFKKDRPILEIGAGLGAVTEYFWQQGFHMFVCEKDTRLASHLGGLYKDKIHLFQGDFLKLPVGLWEGHGISQCVSNLPFHLSTDIITHLILKMPFIERALLGVQLEFAKRLLNQEKSSSLSILVKIMGEIKSHKKIKKNNFFPRPGYDACWIFWKRNRLIKDKDIILFEKLLQAAFWGKRKPLMNSLRRNPFFTSQNPHSSKWLQKLDQTKNGQILELLKKRPDALTHLDYIKLFKYLES